MNENLFYPCTKQIMDNIDIVECHNLKNLNFLANESSRILEVSEMNGTCEEIQRHLSISIFKTKLFTSAYYCNTCNQIHPSKEKKEDKKIDKGVSLIESINKADSYRKKSLSSIQFQNENKLNNHEVKIKNFNDSLKNLLLISSGFQIIFKDNCDSIRKKINNLIDNCIINELKENYDKLLNVLIEYQQNCFLNVDKDSSFWKELESLLSINKLDCDTIQFYLDQEYCEKSNDSITILIKNFRQLIQEKENELELYLSMGKKASFILNAYFKLNEENVGFLNYTESQFSKNISKNIYSDYENLKKIIEYNRIKSSLLTLPLLNYLKISDKVNEIDFNKQLFNLFTIDSCNRIILSNRFANPNQQNEVNCHFYLFDIDGYIIKELEIKDKLVRCIQTNSKYLLFTIENNQIDKNDKFELNLYDLEFNLINSIQVMNNQTINTNTKFIFPIAINLSEDKIFVFKSTIPFVNVYDINLNLLMVFGQNIDRGNKFFIKPNLNSISRSSNLFYTSYQTNNGTALDIFDLNTGLNVKNFEFKHSFSNFYIITIDDSNAVLFYCTKENKFFIFDLKTKKILIQFLLENIDTNANQIFNKNIIPFCLTKKGNIAVLSQTGYLAFY